MALAPKVAAIAPVISSVFGDEPVRQYVLPTLIINGGIDERVKVNGGELTGFPLGIEPADKPTLPIEAQEVYWASVNGCAGFSETNSEAYRKRVYSGCAAGGAVESYVVHDNGHAWPGGEPGRSGADEPSQANLGRKGRGDQHPGRYRSEDRSDRDAGKRESHRRDTAAPGHKVSEAARGDATDEGAGLYELARRRGCEHDYRNRDDARSRRYAEDLRVAQRVTGHPLEDRA